MGYDIIEELDTNILIYQLLIEIESLNWVLEFITTIDFNV